MIKNKPDLPQHNQEEMNDFVINDIPSGKPYFCFLKKTNGELHILSNIYSEDNLKLVVKDFLWTMKSWVGQIKEDLNENK